MKEALRNGSLNPEKLAEMTSAERNGFFKDLVGEDNASQTNALFESKLLLKHKAQGYASWAKKLIGLSPQAKRDILSRIEKLDKVLSPAEEKQFLRDLAEQKLGVGVSYNEAQTITDLTNKVKSTREAMNSGEDRMKYGRAQVELLNYLSNLKQQAGKMSFRQTVAQPFKHPLKTVSALSGQAKSIQASMDNSAIFRQGWKTMWTHPGIWAKNGARSFHHLVRLWGQDKVMNELNADIMSRPTYDLMKKAKLDVGAKEEAYPSGLPEKIPVLGRVFKASENAYTAFVQKTRADVFDKYIEIAERTNAKALKSGKPEKVDLSDIDQLQSIGKMVNSLTGRGNLGKAEVYAEPLNNLFFSPKMIKSQFDVLTQPVTGAGGSSFVRKQAAINLAKIFAGQAAVLTIARQLCPDCVELNPTSADFGKIKIGNTRFDMTGGSGGILIALAKLVTGKSKSSTSNKVTNIYSGKFGTQDGMDVVVDFFTNKLSPALALVRDRLKGENFDGKTPTIPGQALSLITPLPVKTLRELLHDPEAKKDGRFVAFAQVMDMLGISANTYSKRSGTKKPDLELDKLLEEIGGVLDTEEEPQK